MLKKTFIASAIFVAMANITGCGSSDTPQNQNLAEALKNDKAGTQAKVVKILETNADIALAAYNDSVKTAKDLQSALATFKADSSEANLVAAKKAWLVSREPYGQTEVYRFRLSPIDSTNYKDEDGPEGDINAWPLGEGLIDYVKEGTDFGKSQLNVTAHQTGVKAPIVPTGNNIINSNSITIDSALLSKTATAEDEHDVIAGYHAIEFLLWGQDLNSDGSADTLESRETGNIGSNGLLPTGGNRPLTDFTTDAHAARRHKYLEVAVAKLIADLEGVRDGWKKGATYRTAFVKAENEAEIQKKLSEILTGMGTLSEGELAGERMQIAFAGNSQEDEHSCFSDNTHRDIVLNAEGVRNSYLGEYDGYDSNLDGVDDAGTKVSGYGFDDLLKSLNQNSLHNKMVAAFDKSQKNYNAIDAEARTNGRPFDVLIQPKNKNADSPVFKTILSLNEQSNVITEVARALSVTGNVVDLEASLCDTTNPAADCSE